MLSPQLIERLSNPRYRWLVTLLIWLVTAALFVVRVLFRIFEDRNQDIKDAWTDRSLDDTQPIPIIRIAPTPQRPYVTT